MKWKTVLYVTTTLLWVFPSVAEVRTWTSATGAQIEAELVEVQGDYAVLQTVEGREFKILLPALSEADQAFIQSTRQSETEEPPVEEPTPRETRSSWRDRPPRVPAREPGEWDQITGADVFAAPDPLPTDHFSGIAAANLPHSIFIGLQYGPQKADVLFFAFEIGEPSRPPETAYVFGPGLPPHLRNRTLKGGRRTVDNQRVMRFRDIKTQSDFGDIRFSTDIELYCGFGRGDTILLVANAKLERGRTACTFVVGGYLNDDAQYGAGTIKSIPLLATPSAAVVARIFGAPVLYGSCAMNKLSLIPKSGMATKLEVSLIDTESERVVENASLDIEEQRLLIGKPDRTINYRFQNMEKGRRHEVEAAIDLGPFLGPVKNRIRFR